jgi:DNA-binding NtrC family response regulator
MDLTKTALIIDDEQSIIRNFSRLLRENGYDVCAVTTGKAALEQVSKCCFDLLLIDFKLPDIDGTLLVENMGDKVKDSVKLMVTGFATMDTRIKALELGIDGFVEKPVEAEYLLMLIDEKMSCKNKSKH